MSRVRPPQDEWARINDLERRLAAVERSNPLQGGGNAIVDDAGNVRVRLGKLPDGTWGISVYAADGVTEEVRLGELSASPLLYGLGILPQETGTPGALQMVGGTISLILAAPGSVSTAGAYTAFAGTNTLTFNVGPAGMVELMIGGEVTMTGATNMAFGLSVDGGAVGNYSFLQAATNTTLVVGAPAVVAMAQGQHTLKCYYVTTGGSANIQTAALTVKPR